MSRSVLSRLSLAACAAAFAFAAPASATPLKFTFTGASVGSFNLDSNPTPANVYSASTMVSISNATGRFAGFDVATFFAASDAGGFFATDFLTLSTYADFYGQQLYSGSLAHPVFAVGIYDLGTRSAFRDIVLTVTDATGAVFGPSRAAPGAPAPEVGAGWLAALAAAAALVLTRRRPLAAA